MGESAYLRARDYRTMFRLIGECRDLGADPVAWRLHLLTALCARLGARVGAGGEATGLDQGHFVPISTVDVGWDNDAERQAMFEWMEHQATSGQPVGLLPSMPGTTDRGLTVAREDVFTDRDWYKSTQFADYLSRSRLDDLIVSFQRIDGAESHFCGLTLFRALGENRFSRRDKFFLEMLHQEITPLIGCQLAFAEEPSAIRLAPRLRQVLDCLLEGDSEKQVANRLGLTAQTINQYVKSVYRHFRVNSRAELMARWIRFNRGLPAQYHDHLPGASPCNGTS
jgi:DNA-binding CsgD family transcriptional regulator